LSHGYEGPGLVFKVMCRRIRLVITLVITHYHMTKGVSIRKIGLILLLSLQRDSRQVEISRVVRSTGVMVESPCSDHDYLNLITRSTEIWYQNRHTGSNRCEICCPFPPLSGTERGYKIHLSSFTCQKLLERPRLYRRPRRCGPWDGKGNATEVRDSQLSVLATSMRSLRCLRWIDLNVCELYSILYRPPNSWALQRPQRSPHASSRQSLAGSLVSLSAMHLQSSMSLEELAWLHNCNSETVELGSAALAGVLQHQNQVNIPKTVSTCLESRGGASRSSFALTLRANETKRQLYAIFIGDQQPTT
jgi:hypothetical protein